MRAPLPWFGSKRFIAPRIWRAFGNPPSFVDPFGGSLAVLLARPEPPGREVINDIDGNLVNFWRAIQADAIAVWKWAHDPPSELDAEARQRWLVGRPDLRARLRRDPHWYDAKRAGWWAWGLSLTIAGTAKWCTPDRKVRPQIPIAWPGGIHRFTLDDLVWLGRRISRVQLVCGDWQRVLSNAYLFRSMQAECAVLLDPPYSEGDDHLYAEHDKTLSARVREWALEHGRDRRLRIALCGYEGEHVMPASWRCHKWATRGGYGHNANRLRERIWFSPHCLD